MNDETRTLTGAARRLQQGETRSRTLVEEALDAIARAPAAFTRVDAEGARAAAEASDRRRSEGRALSDLDGVPVSVKDLFDVAGQRTEAGSRLLAAAPPAQADAPAVAALRGAGLVLIGRTHMSEFAFTGLGLNPHGRTLVNPLTPDRAPGGSSGGAAASVALGQSYAALGTDTGGSLRIPAAFCGLVGFKPTQRRVSREGAYPLSPSLDSIGPIARTTRCCRRIDALLAFEPSPGGEERAGRVAPGLSGAVLGVPDEELLGEIEPEVARSFERALQRLRAAGARIERIRFEPLQEVTSLQARGSIASAEAYAFHRRVGHLDRAEEMDPEVRVRILAGGRITAADYLDLLEARARLGREANRLTAEVDALALPTTPAPAPRLDDLGTPAVFQAENARALRLPSVFNFLDRCAVSLPMAADGDAALGFMLVGETLGDARLLDLAEAVEPVIA